MNMNSMKQFLQDEKGSITVEFVIWLPFLLFWFVLSVAAFAAWDNRLDSTRATYTIADILSREIVVNNAVIDSYFRIFNQLLPAADETPNQMRLSSIRYNAINDEYEVLWSEARPETDRFQAFSVTEPLIFDQVFPEVPPQFFIDLDTLQPKMDDQETVVMVEAYVTYQPITGLWGTRPLRWANRQVAKPRFQPQIAFSSE